MTNTATREPVGLGPMEPIFAAVSRKYRVPQRVICGPGKTSLQLEARQVCCWLASKLTRLSPVEIGEAVGRGRTAAGQALARIERLRQSEPTILALTNELLSELKREFP